MDAISIAACWQARRLVGHYIKIAAMFCPYREYFLCEPFGIGNAANDGLLRYSLVARLTSNSCPSGTLVSTETIFSAAWPSP